MPAQDQRERSILKLLVEKGTVAILRAFPEDPISPSELEQRLADTGIGHSLLGERLRCLTDNQVLTHQRIADAPPHAFYDLTELGRDMRTIPDTGRAWEREWNLGRPPRDGVWAVRVLADWSFIPIIGGLADGPLQPHELHPRLRGMSRTSMMRKLRGLLVDGLLVREGHHYACCDSARNLALLGVYTARCEWRRGTPVDPVFASDLHTLVHALAPLIELPAELRGSCHLHVDGCEQCLQPDVYASVEAGRLIAIPHASPCPPNATAHATAEAWCEAVLGHCLDIGGEALVRAIVQGIRRVLAPGYGRSYEPAHKS